MKSNNKGIALFLSITLLFLLSIASIAVLLTAYNYANITENQIKRTRALSLAEAGINYAYWYLRDNPGFTGNIPTIYPDPGTPGVDITVTADSGRYRIDSTVQY